VVVAAEYEEGIAMRRIVLTGPESSGKTTLTRALGDRFHLPCAFEYARLYLEKHGPRYDYEIVHDIARCHLLHQAQQVPASCDLGFFDTDLLNFLVWCEVAFGRCEPWLREAAAAESDHVYLICQPDLPWEYDALREYPEGREALFEKHLAAVQATGRAYRIISGSGPDRLERAIQAVTELRENC
jgi:nicotinamide riboside kinase